MCKLQDQRKLAQTKTQQVPSGHQETLFHCDQVQVAQRGCGVSILQDTEKLRVGLDGPFQYQTL